MKRYIILIICICTLQFAYAQYNDILYLSESKAKLVQIDANDDVTLFYFTYTSAGKDSYIYISDNIRLKVDGRSYPLLKAGNIPVSHDGKDKSLFGKEGKKTHFVLAFEKVDISKPFDLIENELSLTAFNYRAIKVNMNSRTRRFDMTVFLEDTPIKQKYLFHAKNGNFIVTRAHGLAVAVDFAMNYEKKQKSCMFIDILNRSGRPLTFNASSIKCTGFRKKKTFDVPVISSNLNVSKPRKWADIVKTLATETQNVTSVSGKRSTLDILARYEFNTKDAQYEKYLQKEKSDLSASYLSNLVINDNECYGGIVDIATQKADYYVVTFNFDGEEYRFKP